MRAVEKMKKDRGENFEIFFCRSEAVGVGPSPTVWKDLEVSCRCHAAKTEDSRGNDQWDPVQRDLADLAPEVGSVCRET